MSELLSCPDLRHGPTWHMSKFISEGKIEFYEVWCAQQWAGPANGWSRFNQKIREIKCNLMPMPFQWPSFKDQYLRNYGGRSEPSSCGKDLFNALFNIRQSKDWSTCSTSVIFCMFTRACIATISTCMRARLEHGLQSNGNGEHFSSYVYGIVDQIKVWGKWSVFLEDRCTVLLCKAVCRNEMKWNESLFCFVTSQRSRTP